MTNDLGDDQSNHHFKKGCTQQRLSLLDPQYLACLHTCFTYIILIKPYLKNKINSKTTDI